MSASLKGSAESTDPSLVTPPRPHTSDRRASSRTRRRSLLALLGLVVAVAAACQPPPPPPPAADSFTFSGSGWGHGVGMSQWGARGMAERGVTYDQILGYYYTGAAVTSRATNDNIRVLATERQNTITLRAVGNQVTVAGEWLPNGHSVTVTRSGSNVVVSGIINRTVANSIAVTYPQSSVTVSAPGYNFHYGSVTVKIDPAGGLRVIVGGLTMSRYLYGLGEMSSSWPMEAIKAQATASRTYAQKKLAATHSRDYDLLGTVIDQAYTGTRHEDARWRAAVDSTANRVITYNGALIDAVYSASSGGHTEHSEVVWVSPLPYLRGKPDPYDEVATNPHNSWSRTYTGQQLGAWFGLGTVTSVQILGNTGASGRVDKATIRLTGTGGTRDVSGPTFRSTVNRNSPSAQLMSTKLVVK